MPQGGADSAAVNTVPKRVTDVLRAVCTALANDAPHYVPSTPYDGARMSYCFENVDNMVARSGGAAVAGWALWHKPGIYYEAEMHCIWKNPAGDLVDVSPQFLNPQHILFVADATVILDPDHPVANRFFVDSAAPSDLAVEYVRIVQRRVDIYNAQRAGFPDVIVLSDADQDAVAQIDARMFEIQSILDA